MSTNLVISSVVRCLREPAHERAGIVGNDITHAIGGQKRWGPRGKATNPVTIRGMGLHRHPRPI
jgi:hypothetical protein